jgi:hypothetical protein
MKGLVTYYGIVSAETSALMAENDQGEISRQATGRLGDDEKAIQVVSGFLHGLKLCDSSAVAGFPRTEPQMRSPVVRYGSILLFLNVPLDEAKRRSDSRPKRGDTNSWPTRIAEYRQRTMPMLEVAKKYQGLAFIEVSGFWPRATSPEQSEAMTLRQAIEKLDQLRFCPRI